MLPFSGQGANQAIEDAGALQMLFHGVHLTEQIPDRIELFERIRKPRVSRVQIMSSVRVGKESEVQEQLQQYAESSEAGRPSIFRTVLRLSADAKSMAQVSLRHLLNASLTTLGKLKALD